MKKISVIILILFLSPQVVSDDWGGTQGKITRIWYYGNTVIVQQDVPNYVGQANCKDNNKWSFLLSSQPDEGAKQRIFSVLLAANASKADIRPIFHASECGPEGHKLFTGKFELW